MPTFSAVALERSLNHGASKSLETPSTKPLLHSKPPVSNAENGEAKTLFTLPKMSPSLYATPKEIPIPNSPSSFPPSPYIVNHRAHRARVPDLLKSRNEEKIHDIADVEVTTTTTSLWKSTSLSFPISEAIAENHHHTNGVHTEDVLERPVWDCSPPHGEFWKGDISNGSNNATDTLEWESYLLEPVRIKANKELESEDFYNQGESVSFTGNTEVEEYVGAERSHNFLSSSGEFYDARDELSSDSGTPSSVNNKINTELREMRLSLLMETEKRRRVEETLEQMELHWRKLREQLAVVGMFLPLDPTRSQYSMNIADELRCQLEVARFFSDSLDCDLVKAEVEMEMGSVIEAKNFEISRLTDRLLYYETVNQEMSQRNQEAIEMARRNGEKRRKKLRWIWGSTVAAITLGGAVLAWPYLPSGNSSSDSSDVAQPRQSPIDLS